MIGIEKVSHQYRTGISSMAESVSNGRFTDIVIESVSHQIRYLMGITSVHNNRYLISIGISSVATVPLFHEEFIHIGIRSASHEFPSLLGISFISHRCLIGGFNIDTSSVSVSEDYRYLIGIDDISISSACHTTLSAVFESTEPSTIPANQPLNINA